MRRSDYCSSVACWRCAKLRLGLRVPSLPRIQSMSTGSRNGRRPRHRRQERMPTARVIFRVAWRGRAADRRRSGPARSRPPARPRPLWRPERSAQTRLIPGSTTLRTRRRRVCGSRRMQPSPRRDPRATASLPMRQRRRVQRSARRSSTLLPCATRRPIVLWLLPHPWLWPRTRESGRGVTPGSGHRCPEALATCRSGKPCVWYRLIRMQESHRNRLRQPAREHKACHGPPRPPSLPGRKCL